MPEASRRVLEGMAPAAMELVADLLGDTAPDELAGYVVIGVLASRRGFKIASNATDDAGEITILSHVIEHLRDAR